MQVIALNIEQSHGSLLGGLEHHHNHGHQHGHQHGHNHEHGGHNMTEHQHDHSHENELNPPEVVTEMIKIITDPPINLRKKNKNKRKGRRFGRINNNANSIPFNFRIPRTSFSCKNRAPGYYADMEAECKVGKKIFLRLTSHVYNDSFSRCIICATHVVVDVVFFAQWVQSLTNELWFVTLQAKSSVRNQVIIFIEMLSFMRLL